MFMAPKLAEREAQPMFGDAQDHTDEVLKSNSRKQERIDAGE